MIAPPPAATYEVASANIENMFFENVDEIRDDRPGATWNGDLKSARLNGADQERRVGTSALLKVMAGDKVEMTVNNFYENYDAQEDSPLNMEDVLGSVISTLTGGNGGSLPGESHDAGLVEKVFTLPNYTTFNNMVQGNADPSKPKAFLNYILFDEEMRIVESTSGAFQANGNGTWTQIGTTTPLEIPRNGYLAVYLTNASQMANCLACADVFFDQLVLRFTRGSLKEESHYYPFGLPMAGMGSAAAGFKENKRKYQSNEYNKALGLNWMDFHARQYDPQLGRFLGVDPLASSGGQDVFSPYAAMGNMPESCVDPNGTMFQVTARDPALRKQFLDAWFGANNYSVDGAGWVTISADQKADAISTFMSYLMSGAEYGSAGASASTQAEANKFATTFIDNIMNPNVVITTKAAKNGIKDWDEITYKLPSSWDDVPTLYQKPQMCVHYVAAYVEAGLGNKEKRSPEDFKKIMSNVKIGTLHEFLKTAFGSQNVLVIDAVSVSTMTALILKGRPGISVEMNAAKTDGHQVAIIAITENLKNPAKSGATVYNPETATIEKRINYFDRDQFSSTEQIISDDIYFIKPK